jgi:hypothetical protein
MSDGREELNTRLFENALELPKVKIRQCLVPRKRSRHRTKCFYAGCKKAFVETKLSKLIVV